MIYSKGFTGVTPLREDTDEHDDRDDCDDYEDHDDDDDDDHDDDINLYKLSYCDKTLSSDKKGLKGTLG